jgi:hypothetical protein
VQEELAMRDLNGWVVGAVGAAALVGAFYLGGRVTASPALDPSAALVVAAAAPTPGGIEFACAPGQRVLMREATATSATSAMCVGDPAISSVFPAAYAPLAGAPATAPYVQRTAITEPLEVYRPRSVPVSYPSERDVRRPVRTKTKSAVIIGSSAAIGATIGGLTKGTKGAVLGGIVGGGAATVWDQVTRRRTDGR